MDGSSLSYLLLLAVVLDCQNVLAPFRRGVLKPTDESSDDYTILVPVYGHPKYLSNLGKLEQHKSRVLLSLDISTQEMAELADTVESKGWRVLRSQFANPSVVSLVEQALPEVTTKYVIRLDGDSWAESDWGTPVYQAELSNVDLCSVKVLVESPHSLVEHLQAVEYQMAMQTRHNCPWMTSGACFIAKTDVLQEALALHSHYFVGEDIETGLIVKSLGLKCSHVDFPVWTEAPNTWKNLYKQRQMWWAGEFRRLWVNLDFNLRHPVYLFQTSLFTYLLLFGKWDDLIQNLLLIPLIILFYTGLTFLVNWQVRSKYMVLLPYYSLLQTLILPVVGMFKYFSIWRAEGYPGRFKFRRFDRKAIPAEAG